MGEKVAVRCSKSSVRGCHSASVTSEGYAFRVIVCTPLRYTASIFKLSDRLIRVTLLFFRDSL